jgi:protein CpxP
MTSQYFFKPLLLSALLATASLGAMAQPAGAPGPEAHGKHHAARMDPAKMQERMQQRQAELKAKLQLSAGQEAAWNSFVQAQRPPARPARLTPEDHKQRQAQFAAMTTPQRIDQMQAMKAQRDTWMTQRADATKTFYAALTPAQQKVFDESTLRGGGRGHGPRGAHSQG